jgi:hypothetical protein
MRAEQEHNLVSLDSGVCFKAPFYIARNRRDKTRMRWPSINDTPPYLPVGIHFADLSMQLIQG